MLRYKEIFLGGTCNNSCLHCSPKQKTSPQEDFAAIAPAIRQRDTDSIAFSGGEPAIRPDIITILETARENGYRRIKLFTNGRAFSDGYLLQRIIHAGCSLFEIKLWASNPSLHDRMTQVTGSFWETVQGIENLAQDPQDKFVCIRVPVCRENLADLENTVTTALNFGASRIILSAGDSSLPFRSLLPRIANAINISIFNRVWILTEGIPFCLMKGLEPHIGELVSGLTQIYERTFQRHSRCVHCIFRELCPGTEAGYLARFGEEEFEPVTSWKYLNDLEAGDG
ncbi:MAG: radical SAM protein [Nitrospirota bacterium]